MIICGDSANIIPTLADESVDLIVTDPPYAWHFMSREWDKALPSVDIWRECLRVLKPGAFAFVMSGPRMDCLSEMGKRLAEAGFETGFTPMFWAYASGFPKAANMGKLVDKRLGMEREVVRRKVDPRYRYDFPESSRPYQGKTNHDWTADESSRMANITAPATPEAQALDGSYAGMQLKPAIECVIRCQKPLTLSAELIIITSEALGLIQEVIQWSNVNSVETGLSRNQTLRDYIAHRNVVGKIAEEAITQAGVVGGPYDPTDILRSTLASMKSDTESMSWSIGLLWKSILADVLSRANKYTTEMATALITDLKTLTLLLSQTIQASTTQDETRQSGIELNVMAVESLLISALIRSLSLDETSAQRDALMSSFMDAEAGESVSIAASPSSGEAKASSANIVPFNAIGITVIIAAMKPLAHGTYIDQALDNRKGVTWLDDCRIPYEGQQPAGSGDRDSWRNMEDRDDRQEHGKNITPSSGRFPANLLVSDNAVDDGRVTRTDNPTRTPKTTGDRSQSHIGDFGIKQGGGGGKVYADAGGFSRYFSLDEWWQAKLSELPESVQRTFPFLVVPKAGKKEKEMGLGGVKPGQKYKQDGSWGSHEVFAGVSGDEAWKAKNPALPTTNRHPTVKPLKLMSYLVTLGSRPGDLVLDPFAGTFTTLMAAKILGRRGLGIEIDEQWCRIGRRRVDAVQERML